LAAWLRCTIVMAWLPASVRLWESRAVAAISGCCCSDCQLVPAYQRPRPERDVCERYRGAGAGQQPFALQHAGMSLFWA
jgi:hypothetical protein